MLLAEVVLGGTFVNKGVAEFHGISPRDGNPDGSPCPPCGGMAGAGSPGLGRQLPARDLNNKRGPNSFSDLPTRSKYRTDCAWEGNA